MSVMALSYINSEPKQICITCSRLAFLEHILREVPSSASALFRWWREQFLSSRHVTRGLIKQGSRSLVDGQIAGKEKRERSCLDAGTFAQSIRALTTMPADPLLKGDMPYSITSSFNYGKNCTWPFDESRKSIVLSMKTTRELMEGSRDSVVGVLLKPIHSIKVPKSTSHKHVHSIGNSFHGV